MKDISAFVQAKEQIEDGLQDWDPAKDDKAEVSSPGCSRPLEAPFLYEGLRVQSSCFLSGRLLLQVFSSLHQLVASAAWLLVRCT